jgi:hypothetical protein
MANLGVEAILVSFLVADLSEQPFGLRTCSRADKRWVSALRIFPSHLLH